MIKPRKPRAKKWDFTAAHLAAYSPDDPCRPFAAMVAADPRAHNRWVHLACRRHALDLGFAKDAAYPFIYDAARAGRPTAFARQFRGLQGHGAGKPLQFLAWQTFCAAQLFGWRQRADPRKRRFRYALVKVPRKNGKTGWVAPIGLLQLAFPPPGANSKVYSLATKEDQAKVAIKDDAMGYLRTSKAWASRFRPRHKSITYARANSEWVPLGSDSDTLDGLRPELAIMDELHAWKNRGLWDVMNSAFGAAFSPLMLQITTEGDDPCGLLAEQEERVTKALEAVERGTYRGREYDEGQYFGVLWQPDKGDKWDALATWHKANPSLGTVKNLAEMQALAVGARSSPQARRDFLIKQLNVRQNTGPARWLDPERWEAGAAKALTPAACFERLRGLPVWGGLDLSVTTDTTSACFIADDPDRPGGILAAWLYWLPDDDLVGRISRDRSPYDLWHGEGWLNLCAGSVIDAAQIEREVLAAITGYGLDLQNLAYDPAYSQGVGQRLQDEHGQPMLICPQRFSTMTAPLKELEKTVVQRLLDHGGNPIAAANVACATITTGQIGGILLAKGRSGGRIDGLAALGIAMAARENSKAQPQAGACGVLMA
jgi:phage terminase large subunit-like protein